MEVDPGRLVDRLRDGPAERTRCVVLCEAAHEFEILVERRAVALVGEEAVLD